MRHYNRQKDSGGGVHGFIVAKDEMDLLDKFEKDADCFNAGGVFNYTERLEELEEEDDEEGDRTDILQSKESYLKHIKENMEEKIYDDGNWDDLYYGKTAFGRECVGEATEERVKVLTDLGMMGMMKTWW